MSRQSRGAAACAALMAVIAGTATGEPARWQRPATLVETPSAVALGECSEGFENVDALFDGGGWTRINRSTPATTWSQALGVGKGARWEQKIDYLLTNVEGLFFNAHAGTPHSVIFTSLYAHEVVELPPDFPSGTGVLSNWLITPPVDFRPGMTLSFWTRKGFYEYAPIWGDKPDRLAVRLCTSGDCGDVGAGPDDVGNYTTTLLTINPDLGMEDDATGATGYPYNGWRKFTVSGLPESGSGRIAFHYHVPEAMDVFGAFGGLGNGNMIGLDSVELQGAGSCPLRTTPLYADGFEPAAPRTITQNTSNAIVSGLTVTCVNATSWLRRFDLDGEFGLAGRIDVESVDIGIERAYSTVPVDVRLHRIANDAALTFANLRQIGARTLNVDQSDRVVMRNVGVTGTVADAAADDLVVEIRKNEFHREFFPGFNDAMQTAPTYLAFEGDNCGTYPEPTDMQNIPGAPDASLVMTVHLAAPAGTR